MQTDLNGSSFKSAIEPLDSIPEASAKGFRHLAFAYELPDGSWVRNSYQIEESPMVNNLFDRGFFVMRDLELIADTEVIEGIGSKRICWKVDKDPKTAEDSLGVLILGMRKI